jgi:hypothetical protein
MMLKDRENVFSFIVNEVKKEIFLLIQKTENFFVKEG